MNLTLPPEIEAQCREFVQQGEYRTVDDVMAAAIASLVREKARIRIEATLVGQRIDDARIEILLQEAENSGDLLELTSEEWNKMEGEALQVLAARNSTRS